MEQSDPTLGLFFWMIIIVVVVAYIVGYRQKVKKLKQSYEIALDGHDKRGALTAGRLYYAALRRKNTLTIYDEQAITNDLNAMDDARKLGN